MSHFTFTQEKQFEKVRVLQGLVIEQELHPSPCPLLAGQLSDLLVFSRKLSQQAEQLLEQVEKHG